LVWTLAVRLLIQPIINNLNNNNNNNNNNRKGLRRIWELPYEFRSDYLSAISGTSPIYDELRRRFRTSLQRVILAILSSFVSLLGTQFIVREYSHLLVVITCCYKRYDSKVEDEFTSCIKSSCCGNDISMKLSSIDRCRNTFAFELILLKV